MMIGKESVCIAQTACVYAGTFIATLEKRALSLIKWRKCERSVDKTCGTLRLMNGQNVSSIRHIISTLAQMEMSEICS